MQLQDREHSYGWISILLHWLTAVIVIAMFVLGERIGFQPTRALERSATALHISVGTAVWIVLVVFLVWRLAQRSPKSPEQHWSLNLLSRIVQYGLLAVVAVQVVTGPVMVWLMGMPLSPFGLFDIPPPFGKNHDLHEVLETIHTVAANLLLPLVGLHVLGALKHLIVDRDGVFQRMLWVRK